MVLYILSTLHCNWYKRTLVSRTDIGDGTVLSNHSPKHLIVLKLGVAHIQVNILQYLGLAMHTMHRGGLSRGYKPPPSHGYSFFTREILIGSWQANGLH